MWRRNCMMLLLVEILGQVSFHSVGLDKDIWYLLIYLLFVLKFFSCMLEEAIDSGEIHGSKISRSSPPISHFFFADDSIFFLELFSKR